jgi:hypothetical protein
MMMLVRSLSGGSILDLWCCGSGKDLVLALAANGTYHSLARKRHALEETEWCSHSSTYTPRMRTPAQPSVPPSGAQRVVTQKPPLRTAQSSPHSEIMHSSFGLELAPTLTFSSLRTVRSDSLSITRPNTTC